MLGRVRSELEGRTYQEDGECLENDEDRRVGDIAERRKMLK